MKGLGFALGSIIGMALTARERRAADLNEIGIRLANQYRYEEALSYLLEAKKLMPNNADIQNNINICRQALNEKRRLLRESRKVSREHNQEHYLQPTTSLKTTKSDSIKYYPNLQDIPEDLLMLFFKEKHSYFSSKSDLIIHSNKYWSNKEIEDFIKEVEFFEDSTPNLHMKIEEVKLLKIQQENLQKKQQLQQQKLEEEQKKLQEERKNLYHRIQYSKMDFQNFIIDNQDDLCRIYSIPKLGKTYVVNQILDKYSPLEVWDALEKYK